MNQALDIDLYLMTGGAGLWPATPKQAKDFPDDIWVRHADHLAVLSAARREERERCAKHLEALAQARRNIARPTDESFTFLHCQAELLESAAGEIRTMSSPAQSSEVGR